MCEPVFTASYIITNFNSYYDLNVHPGEEIWLSCDCLLSLGWLLLMLLSKCLTFFWYSFTLVKETPLLLWMNDTAPSADDALYCCPSSVSGLCCVTMQSFMFDRKGSRTLAYGSLVCCSFCSWDLRQKSLLVGWPKSWLGETWKHAPP